MSHDHEEYPPLVRREQDPMLSDNEEDAIAVSESNGILIAVGNVRKSGEWIRMKR